MKLTICAGPSTTGKTTVIRQVIRRLLIRGLRPAYLKLDVQYADEDELIAQEFGIPTRKVYSEELCPDHCSISVMCDVLRWAENQESDMLLLETAGLCLRCAPYVDSALGMAVLEATSGMNLPRKLGPILSLADMAVVTKVDLVSQAEREVFRANVKETAPHVRIREVDALHGTGIEPVVAAVIEAPETEIYMKLRGTPPVGTCTICAGRTQLGWEHHFGGVSTLENPPFYRA